ncbi:MAG: polysaccharide deacetylase family protein [Chitinivibrionia bacterium]|nr:polysaccharide deacetylase family protein [Chitinivibrionia bacterium]
MNILTFDIEEWFHILDNDSTKTAAQWRRYESRIHINMERIFKLLNDTGVKATFFILGWIAQEYPDVVRKIVDSGYEIGSHTQNHQLVYEQDSKTFSEEVERSIKTLEDISGKKVRCFRAPGFSIREDNRWAFDVLVKEGISMDSSVFPAPRAHGGFPSYTANAPAYIKYDGIVLKEFPISYANVLGKPVIYSGGGYFRLFPYFFIKRWAKNAPYLMTYFHPRDFDAGQPMIGELSLKRKFRSYVGISGAYNKLKNLLNDFDFIDIDGADKLIDWEKADVVAV